MDLGYNFIEKASGWIGAIALAIIVGIIFLKQSRVLKRDSPVVSRIKRGYSIFLLGWAACRIFFLLSDNEKLVNMVSNNIPTLHYSQLLLTGYVLMIIAMSWLVWAIESHMQGSHALPLTKFLIVTCIVIGVIWIIAIFYAAIVETARLVAFIVGPVLGLVVIIFYIRLTIQSTGAVRRRVFLNFLAFVLIFLGHTIDSEWVRSALSWVSTYIWLPGIISAVGVLCFYVSQKSE